jgi:hypothetical protein
MVRAKSSLVTSKQAPSLPASPAWSEWPLKLQTIQLHATRDLLDVFNRYVAALAAARDAQAIGEAQRVAFGDWTAWIEGVQQQWVELARAVPPGALAALGWRLKPAAHAQAAAAGDDAPRDLFEQSKLAIEMLLRPWIGPPDLEHTDEFVA